MSWKSTDSLNFFCILPQKILLGKPAMENLDSEEWISFSSAETFSFSSTCRSFHLDSWYANFRISAFRGLFLHSILWFLRCAHVYIQFSCSRRLVFQVQSSESTYTIDDNQLKYNRQVWCCYSIVTVSFFVDIWILSSINFSNREAQDSVPAEYAWTWHTMDYAGPRFQTTVLSFYHKKWD